jgi:hypothetical protein
MFNVEKYIETCLESVLAEQAASLEIIVVDDGSTDSSRARAEAIARTDRRVWVFHQRNHGLGAARNAGMRRAHGTYAAFLDADDVTMPGAHRALVEAAEKAKADIAIGGIFQVVEGKKHFPEWMRFIHDSDRVLTSVRDFPDLLRDFYTPNKLVRRTWWGGHGWRFRERVMFEDQPVITQALTAASGLAVLRMMTYQWRRREDGSSLTQTMYTADKIAQRAHATALTRPVVEAPGDPRFRDAWTYTLVENHFLTYVRHLPEMDAAARAQLVAFVRAAGSENLLRRPTQVSPAAAALATLVHRGELDAAERLVAAGWTEAGRARIRGAAGEAELATELGDPALAASLHPCFEGREVDPRRFVVRVETARWADDGALHLTVSVPFVEMYGWENATLEADVVDSQGTVLARGVVSPLADGAQESRREGGTARESGTGPRQAVGPVDNLDAAEGSEDRDLVDGSLRGPQFHVVFAAGELARIPTEPATDPATDLEGRTPRDPAPSPPTSQGASPCPLRFAIVQGERRLETHTAVRPSPLPSRQLRTWRHADGSGLLLRWRDRYWLRLDPLPAPPAVP